MSKAMEKALPGKKNLKYSIEGFQLKVCQLKAISPLCIGFNGRLKGNFEFDGKSPRKPIDMPSVNENRFLTKVDYIEKKTPYIQMDKYLPRDNSFLQGVNMSDSLFQTDLLDKIKK